MIKTWKNAKSLNVFDRGMARGIRGLDTARAVRRLANLDAASSLAELSPLKSVGLHKLGGKRKDQWAITINGPWRVCFEFRKGHAYNVEIVDYHKG